MGRVLCIYASGHSAIGEQCSHTTDTTKKKNIPVFAACNAGRHKPILWSAITTDSRSIGNCESRACAVLITNVTRSSLASAVGQRRQCRWVQRFGSNGNPPNSSVHVSYSPFLLRSIWRTLYESRILWEYGVVLVEWWLVVIVDYRQEPSPTTRQ